MGRGFFTCCVWGREDAWAERKEGGGGAERELRAAVLADCKVKGVATDARVTSIEGTLT